MARTLLALLPILALLAALALRPRPAPDTPALVAVRFTGLRDEAGREVSVEAAAACAGLPSRLELHVPHLTRLPALTDPHVHFRTPGHEHKEDWTTASRAAVAGGVTTVLDMPNNAPFMFHSAALAAKRSRILHQLALSALPLRFGLYVHPDPSAGQAGGEAAAAAVASGEAVGVKLYLGASTGGVQIEPDSAGARAVFAAAARLNFTVAVHAETQTMLDEAERTLPAAAPAAHSLLRTPQAAADALRRAIAEAEATGARLYVVHVSTRAELAEVRAAKARGVDVWVEACPHHLLLSEADYGRWGNKVVVNPPVRSAEDVAALWEAVLDGTVDTFGTDHAPHTAEEKAVPYPKAPAGIPAVELALPLMLDAVSRGLLDLPRLVSLTSERPEAAFRLPPTRDAVLVDMARTHTVADSELCTKAGWSPYAGRTLTGWPVFTVLDGKLHAAGPCEGGRLRDVCSVLRSMAPQ